MTEEDRLISSPPMDIIVQKRQSALKDLAKQRRREKELKPDRVKSSYTNLLQNFANKYFKGRTRYSALSPQEQKALAKICLRHSLKKSFMTLLSSGAGISLLTLMGKTTGDMIGLGVLGLIFATVLVGVADLVMDLVDSFYIHESFLFIKNHLFLKRKKLL